MKTRAVPLMSKVTIFFHIFVNLMINNLPSALWLLIVIDEEDAALSFLFLFFLAYQNHILSLHESDVGH